MSPFRSLPPEALGLVINGLYQKFLHRASDDAEQAFFVPLLQHGTTVEQAITMLVTSAEYAALVGSDAAFVQSLYAKLLDRAGSRVEVAAWLGRLPKLGRLGVATAILASPEFCCDETQGLEEFRLAPTLPLPGQGPPLRYEAPASA